MSKENMAKNTDKQAIENMSDNFRGYATLLRKIKQRVLIAQQRAIYAANEEMLRMYWDIGGMLQQSQDADGWGKKTLQRLAVDLKNDYSEIKGFSVRNMQCMIQFFNEYNQELTMVKGEVFPITQPVVAQGVLPDSGRLCRICRSTIIGLRVKRDLTVDLSQFVNAVKDQLLSFS